MKRLMNAPDDSPAERAAKFGVRQCIIVPVLVVLIIAVVILVTHH